jgi:hypothetical protein
MVDFKVSAIGACRPGIVARFPVGGNLADGLFATVAADIAASAVIVDGASIPFNFVANTFYTLQLVVTATGRVIGWCWPTGGVKGDPLYTYVSSFYTAGNEADSGQAGILDYGIVGITRTYDNFYTWMPDIDATLYPNRQAELRTDGMYRESIDGSYFGPISNVVGDLPRLPVAGLEQRPVEVLIMPSYGDFKQAPHYAGFQSTSSTKVQLLHRPCYLFVP